MKEILLELNKFFLFICILSIAIAHNFIFYRGWYETVYVLFPMNMPCVCRLRQFTFLRYEKNIKNFFFITFTLLLIATCQVYPRWHKFMMIFHVANQKIKIYKCKKKNMWNRSGARGQSKGVFSIKCPKLKLLHQKLSYEHENFTLQEQATPNELTTSLTTKEQNRVNNVEF